MEEAIKFIDNRLISIAKEKKNLQEEYVSVINSDALNSIAERNMMLSMLAIELEYIKTLLK